jgi:hypothetical protein
MRSTLACLSLAAILGFAGCGAAENPQAETAAVAAAEAWLSLIDDQRYAEAWEQAAQLFKGAIQKEQWVRTMEAVRKPLGKTLSRELKSKQYRTTVPGAPDGEYVVIRFDASFANKKSAVETITPMRDPDGQWRVSGYYMK